MTDPCKLAVVTGAGSGIGRAVSLTLLAAGYHVVLTGRRLQALTDTAALAGEHCANAHAVAADVSDPVSVASLFQAAQTRFARLDLLFNNAGTNAPAVPVDELTYEQWKAVVDINLTGVFLCTQAAFKWMKTQRPQGGRIINNGSISAHAPRPFSAPYSATKHAVTGLTKSTSLDGRAHNIACGHIDICNAATDMTTRMAQGTLQANGSLLAEPRMDVQVVANAVLHMASLPLEANVQFMTVMATAMPFVGRG